MIQDVAELSKALSHERTSWPDFGCFTGWTARATLSVLSFSHENAPTHCAVCGSTL